MDEIWKDIKGYENKYQISNKGRVRNLTYKRQKVPKVLKPFSTYRGYYRVSLFRNNRRKDVFIHRLVALTFIPNPNNYPVINHKNGNKSDNRIENLEWCTQSENVKHAYNTGLRKKYFGANHWNYKTGKYVKKLKVEK